MFDRFTDRSRRVMILAGQDAHKQGARCIGTEHLLIGMIEEGESCAYEALVYALPDEPDALLRLINEARELSTVERAEDPSEPVSIPLRPHLTPRARKVVELSLREALQLGHAYIAPEHILLGIIREGMGIAAKAMQARGLELLAVRQAVIASLNTGYLNGKNVTITVPASVATAGIDWMARVESTFGPFASRHPVSQLRDALVRARQQP